MGVSDAHRTKSFFISLFCVSIKVRNKLRTLFCTMTFAIKVRDWLIRGVWREINQTRARIVMDFINTEDCYVIHLLCIIDTQIKLGWKTWRDRTFYLLDQKLKLDSKVDKKKAKVATIAQVSHISTTL